MVHSPSKLLALFPLLLLAINSPGCLGRHKHFHSRVPIVDLNGAEELIGTVREDEPLVTISPQLRILHGTGPICRYELSWADDMANGPNVEPIPFEARVIDSADGTAQIRHKTGSAALDCAQRAKYRLRLEAIKCGDEMTKSESVELRISVQDVNNHAPEFDAPWYSFDVDEGKTAPMEIARLLATDKDCGHPYGKVCRYELTNTLPNNPFHIDDRGILSALRPLNRSQAQSHVLTVVAEDCGMLRSKSVLVTVNIRPRCVDSFKSMSGKIPIHIVQGDSPKFVLPDAEVHICAVEDCTAEADLMLENVDEEREEHLIGKQILRECGIDTMGIELLSGEEEMNGNGTNKSEEGGNDDGDDATEEEEDEEDEKQWMFDGKQNIEISKRKLANVIPERFSLIFSMKTEPGTEEQQRQKQNILCETDEHGLNRHHFAVYIRHCKLELLLRREPEEASAEFRAAEWRWSDQQICDGQWHQYGLLFSDLDNVQLTIDGIPFNASQRNPEILDDWPLHQVKDKRTRLVVGACWHGRQKQMVQHFIGHLSSMWIWNDQVQSNEAVNCAHGNHEKLQMAEENGHPSIGHSSIHFNAKSTAELARLLRSVQYSLDSTISHLAPFVREGQRRIQVTGSLNCPNNVSRPLAPISALVEVSRSQANPQLSVTGRHIVLADRQSLKSGVSLLPEVQITVTEGPSDVTSVHKLDWCRVHLRPTRDMDLELFSSPTILLEKLDLQFAHDKQGFALKGRESPKAYADVLAHIHYFNLRPDSFPHRSYTLQCAMMDGKLLSNELFTTMNIDAATPMQGNNNNELDEAVQKLVQISDKLDHDMLPSGMEANNKETDGPLAHHLELPSFDQLGANRLQNILEMDLPRPKALLGHHGYEVGQGAVAGGAVAVVVVICVGFLLILLVIGVLKMRDQPLGPRRRRSRRDSMLEWDDNGMVNITINPLEEVSGKAMSLDYSEAEDEDEEEEDDDSGSEDGGEGYREVEVSEDEAGDEQVLPLAEAGNHNGVGLEWDDDSTLDGSPTALSSQNHGKKGHRL